MPLKVDSRPATGAGGADVGRKNTAEQKDTEEDGGKTKLPAPPARRQRGEE